jgi:hypothetical protein
MPFTVSHAAAVLPFARRRLVLSALVVGSMAPDFEYLLRLSLVSRWGHTLPGIFFFSLPVGLLVLWMFHALFKQPLLTLLPTAHRLRLESLAGPFPCRPVSRFLLSVASLLLGILSHVLLDSFTHPDGLMVQALPALQAQVFSVAGWGVRRYQLLQYSLSVAGAAWLAWRYWQWYRATPTPPAATCSGFVLSPAARLHALAWFVYTAALAGTLRGLLALPPALTLASLRLVAGLAFATAAACLLFELLIYAFAVKHLLTPATTPAAPEGTPIGPLPRSGGRSHEPAGGSGVEFRPSPPLHP